MGQLYPQIDVKVGKLARFNDRLQGGMNFKLPRSRLSTNFEEGDD